MCERKIRNRFKDIPNEPITLLAIDPGTDTLGVSVFSLDLLTFKLSLLHAETLQASKTVRRYESLKDLENIKGGRKARLDSHKERLTTILEDWQPSYVGCESPFMGRRANAFEALVECVVAIKEAVEDYDKSLVVDMISPPSAKKSVGVKAKGSDKDSVRNAIIKIVESKDKDKVLNTTEETKELIYTLDEHSIDSIAVGVHLAHEIISLYKV